MNELRAGEPYTLGNVTLVPIERVYLQSNQWKLGYRLTAFKEPHAVIICDAKGLHVLNLDAKEIPLQTLVQKIPDIDKILATFIH